MRVCVCVCVWIDGDVVNCVRQPLFPLLLPLSLPSINYLRPSRARRCDDEIVSAPNEALKRTRARTRTRRYTVSPPVDVRVFRVYGSVRMCAAVSVGTWVSPVFVRERFIAPSCPRQSVPRTYRNTRNDARECRCETGTRGNMCGLLHSAVSGGVEEWPPRSGATRAVAADWW
jgi:hypothetical protein